MMPETRGGRPLDRRHRLGLGTFCTNLSGGCTMSDIEGILQADWPTTTALAQLAEAMDFEAIVPVGRWKGFGGRTDFNGAGFESYTWAAGISASTRRAGVFATSHVSTVHPIVAAKQATTIDHISNGRFGLNVVTGWYQPEMEMFGTALLEHDRRYDMAAEWLGVVRRLWTEDEPFDFSGAFYTLKQARLRPKPIQQPHPVVMCAGSSDKGRHFAAQHADVSFVNVERGEPDAMRAQVDSIRRLAREEYGRDIQVWTYAYVFQAETEAEAKRFYDYTVFEHGDWPGADNLIHMMEINSQSFSPEMLHSLEERFVAGWAGFPLVGTPDQVVDGLRLIADAGFDGTLLSWPRYLQDMQVFKDRTLPLLEQAGLR